jgi:transposase InsO family protein
LAHPHQGLSVLIHLEPPVTHGHLRQKSRKHSRFTKVRTPEGGSQWRLYGENPLAPLGRKPSGSFTPKSKWLHIAESSHLAEAGIEPSVGSVGDSYDNALAETINGLYKAEVIHRKSWQSLEKVEWATLTWVDWFNHRRLLEPIGYIPPAEAEAAYYRRLTESAMAA